MVVISIAIYHQNLKSSNIFYGLLFLMQAGIMGVFTATDGLLFYFFWELALIPAYFLCSIWGGEKRIAITFKFFIYTFVGSLVMLLSLVYLYLHTSGTNNFSIQSLMQAKISIKEQNILFWMMFVAFAIKMPVFPLHTWQPDAYEQAPTPVTMMLSGVMVKMGLFAVIQWLLPIFPKASEHFACVIICISVIGMIYASLIAIKQDDLKRLIAYSSIAHIGLMSAALFANNQQATQGVYIQLFNHGINVIGLWIVADVIEKYLGTRKLSELGGLATNSPTLAILLVIMAFANVALPLTNAFVGEFLMFSGLFTYSKIITAIAGISIILSAVYTLGMVQKIFYGEVNTTTSNGVILSVNTKLALYILVSMVIVFGVYSNPLLNLVK
jgi:NADH-quinone oxidoreductase subunit M